MSDHYRRSESEEQSDQYLHHGVQAKDYDKGSSCEGMALELLRMERRCLFS